MLLKDRITELTKGNPVRIVLPKDKIRKDLENVGEYIRNLERYIEYLEDQRRYDMIHLIQLTKKYHEIQAVQLNLNN